MAGFDGVEIVQTSGVSQDILSALPFDLNKARSGRIRLAAQSSSAVNMLERMEHDLKRSVFSLLLKISCHHVYRRKPLLGASARDCRISTLSIFKPYVQISSAKKKKILFL